MQVNYVNLLIALFSLIASATIATLIRRISQQYYDAKNKEDLEKLIINSVTKNSKMNEESEKLKAIEGR